MKPVELNYARAATVAAAIGELKQCSGQARVIAGGQSLGPMLNLRLAQPSHLIDISRIDDLCVAGMEDDMLVIGACVTHARIEDGEIPDATRGLMRRVAGGIAYRAVRNRGTIGGSLAHADPAADWLTTMIALDASVRLHGPAGRREIKVSKFVVGALETAIADGEVVTHVSSSPPVRPRSWGSRKVRQEARRFLRSRWRSRFAIRSGAYSASFWVGAPSRRPCCAGSRTADRAKRQSRRATRWRDRADFETLADRSRRWTMHRAIVAARRAELWR